jgi:hypothetical protein
VVAPAGTVLRVIGSELPTGAADATLTGGPESSTTEGSESDHFGSFTGGKATVLPLASENASVQLCGPVDGAEAVTSGHPDLFGFSDASWVASFVLPDMPNNKTASAKVGLILSMGTLFKEGSPHEAYHEPIC